MMKKIISAIFMLMLGVGTTSIASAQGFYMNRYMSRITQGVRTGVLTQREANRLESRVMRLQSYERSARADGYLDWRERRFIEQEKAQLDRAIFRQKHDWQNRWDR
jgi:hypothetical protein